ncbi:hypothetical protein QYE47_23275 [Pseudomonas sp. 2,4-D]|uniref:hypothetical protein n=1 Tax=Pseudomonas sp. 2,4-D TaxID=3058433 RepID=UPI0026106B45|nr:hypothetical protein [Pseudomonas sp. 2,4-D]MDN4515447.1 hypothetical protein [Pseudomonas sp. 2,4-D]
MTHAHLVDLRAPVKRFVAAHRVIGAGALMRRFKIGPQLAKTLLRELEEEWALYPLWRPGVYRVNSQTWWRVMQMEQALRAWWVGDMEIFAAVSAEQALQLAEGIAGPGCYDLDDVQPVEDATLAKGIRDEDGNDEGRLIDLLRSTKAPCLLLCVE